jgi:hypothetical protein
MRINSILFILLCIISLLWELGMLLFWCIKFIGAKTLSLLSMYASWLVGPVGGAAGSVCMFWVCKRAQTRII